MGPRLTHFKYEVRGTKDEVAKPKPKLFAIDAVEAMTAMDFKNDS